MSYHVRRATLDDLDTLVYQRVAMFDDMGVPLDRSTLNPAFARWLEQWMPSETYIAWLIDWESGSGERVPVSGGGATILPWPPGPHYQGGRLAFVYNIYTEPEHRQRGLAKMIMHAIHEWCGEHGVTSAALNASEKGRALYVDLGYAVTPSPMMFRSIDASMPAPRGPR